jgi:hypothetical protein
MAESDDRLNVSEPPDELDDFADEDLSEEQDSEGEEGSEDEQDEEGLPSESDAGQPGSHGMPMKVGGFTVHSFGFIPEHSAGFHNASAIVPVGYAVSRPYYSMVDPHRVCMYLCRVLANGSVPQVFFFFCHLSAFVWPAL